MRLWFITSWIKDGMTLSLINLLANWAETAKGGKQRGQFLQNSCLPSPWARPKEPGERTPYYILVSERVCFTNCDWKTLYQNVNGGDSRRNEDLKKKNYHYQNTVFSRESTFSSLLYTFKSTLTP